MYFAGRVLWLWDNKILVCITITTKQLVMIWRFSESWGTEGKSKSWAFSSNFPCSDSYVFDFSTLWLSANHKDYNEGLEVQWENWFVLWSLKINSVKTIWLQYFKQWLELKYFFCLLKNRNLSNSSIFLTYMQYFCVCCGS